MDITLLDVLILICYSFLLYGAMCLIDKYVDGNNNNF